jgi:methyl-accepting chemotaxis protein
MNQQSGKVGLGPGAGVLDSLLRSFSLRARVLSAFGLVALVLAALGLHAIATGREFAQQSAELYRSDVLPMSHVNRISLEFLSARVDVRDALTLLQLGDTAGMARLHKRAVARLGEVERFGEEYGKTIRSDEERRLFDAYQEALGTFRAVAVRVVEATAAGRGNEAARIVVNECIPGAERVTDAILALMNHEQSAAAASDRAAQEAAGSTARLQASMVFGGALVAFLLGWLIVRSVVRPVRLALVSARAMADGDLTPFQPVSGRDEISEMVSEMARATRTLDALVDEQRSLAEKHRVDGTFGARMPVDRFCGAYGEVARSINDLLDTHISVKDKVVEAMTGYSQGDLRLRMEALPGEAAAVSDAVDAVQASLVTIIGQIKEATDSINTAAKEIAQGNTDLSQRTEEQASSLQQTASSMEELTSTVKQNSENAKQANQLAIGASEVAVRGGAVVGEVVRTMDEITAASKKISDIISVIDGIAFQTNILALNAAVEAARAGEQGRGFAVVATEVRNLAQRSAAAAREIKALIGDSVQKVESGSRLVGEAGTTIQEVVQQVKRVTDIMSEISAASMEQSSGIEQVNTAVTQMDEVTQQNAALVEQAAAAAESLQEQAESLAESVSVFKLEGQAASVRGGYDGAERRGPNRATNVSRLKPAAASPDAPQAAMAQGESEGAARSPERPVAARPARAVNADESWEEF